MHTKTRVTDWRSKKREPEHTRIDVLCDAVRENPGMPVSDAAMLFRGEDLTGAARPDNMNGYVVVNTAVERGYLIRVCGRDRYTWRGSRLYTRKQYETLSQDDTLVMVVYDRSLYRR